MRLKTHRMRSDSDTNHAKPDVSTRQKIEDHSYSSLVLTSKDILAEVGQIFAEGYIRILLKTSDTDTSA